jgi:hypothetical protein
MAWWGWGFLFARQPTGTGADDVFIKQNWVVLSDSGR